MLPIPKDPNFKVESTEEEFYDLDAPEDEALIAAGALDGYSDNDEEKVILESILDDIRGVRESITKK